MDDDLLNKDDDFNNKKQIISSHMLVGTNAVFTIVQIFLELVAFFLVLTNCLSCTSNDKFCYPQITLSVKDDNHQSSVEGGISLREVQECYSMISSVIKDLSPENSEPLPTLHLFESGTQYKLNYAGYCRYSNKEKTMCRRGSVDVFAALISDTGSSLDKYDVFPKSEIAGSFLLNMYHEILLDLPRDVGKGKGGGEGYKLEEIPLILRKVAAYTESCFRLQYVLSGVLAAQLSLEIATVFFGSLQLYKVCMWWAMVGLSLATIGIIPMVLYCQKLRKGLQVATFIHISRGSGEYVHIAIVLVLLVAILTKMAQRMGK